ncbi:DNA-3-methyladenine glycosylase I [Eubacterium barkeri]|uniref:DNA-3-methyladenine glycosylase I n=1 Tax=Eubacterium barkeri TaxID=1528 RepID=A0A1H3FN59_EUBBA|nr:DNA-3-methyladenine glycosylase I [Eubacterium barkeri]SDX92381.1 DNA-3-methyladenine glycosylase I [Eubacterium barkeri]
MAIIIDKKEEGLTLVILQRCTWVDLKSAEYINYHDNQWGVPVHDDGLLFEMLILEGFQAGLSWLTILKKRENFRKAFDGFDPAAVAAYDTAKKEALMQDAGIVRNRRKIDAAVKNAQVFLEIQEEYGSFDTYLWGFTQGQTLVNNDDVLPAKTPLSDAISADLKGRGMGFVGSTIIYAFLQAVGVVNDHALGCFCHPKQSGQALKVYR